MNSTMPEDTFFPEATLTTALAKISALEEFLNIAVRDCKFNEFILEVLTTILKAVNCEAGSILEADYQTNTLFFRAVVGSSADQVVNFAIPFGQGIVGHVAESRMPLIVDNIPE